MNKRTPAHLVLKSAVLFLSLLCFYPLSATNPQKKEMKELNVKKVSLANVAVENVPALLDKEKVDFLKNEYGTGGHSHALSGAGGSWEDHDGKGLHYKKDGCPDVHFTWEKVAKRITDLIQKGRYLTEQEQAESDKIQADKALAEEDALQAQQPDPAVWEYNGVKERHPDDIILYQMGDFFELYGEDAKTAAAELEIGRAHV